VSVLTVHWMLYLSIMDTCSAVPRAKCIPAGGRRDTLIGASILV
jgi:hypothetical protein